MRVCCMQFSGSTYVWFSRTSTPKGEDRGLDRLAFRKNRRFGGSQPHSRFRDVRLLATTAYVHTQFCWARSYRTSRAFRPLCGFGEKTFRFGALVASVSVCFFTIFGHPSHVAHRTTYGLSCNQDANEKICERARNAPDAQRTAYVRVIYCSRFHVLNAD